MSEYTDKTPKNQSNSAALNTTLQRKIEPADQFVDNRPQAIAQRKLQEAADHSSGVQQLKAYQEMANKSSQVKQLKAYQAMADSSLQPIQKKANNTGLPDNLKTGVERISGFNMDDVKVHYNSGKPAQLQAHAYAQGTDIHLASGQEKHLPHEAWHVVQQKQGRVKPTIQMKGGVNVNDNAGLEHEADIMGAKASSSEAGAVNNEMLSVVQQTTNNATVQRVRVVGDFANTSQLAEIGNSGVYVAGQTTNHSQIKNLVEAISNHLIDYYENAAGVNEEEEDGQEEEQEEEEQEIVILSGCHGDAGGNLIYNEDNFYAEDSALLGGYVAEVVDMQTLDRAAQVAQMNRDDCILILSWCYSSKTYENINTYEIVG